MMKAGNSGIDVTKKNGNTEANDANTQIPKSLFRSVCDTLFPVGSRRRVLVKLLWRLVRQPKRLVHAINRERVRKFFAGLRNGDILLLNEKLEKCVGSRNDTCMLPQIIQIESDKKSISDYERITFSVHEHPTVSIVIPAYNQFNYTYLCLKSILNNSRSISYEIIIADDCSTDFTTQICDVVEGIRVARTSRNLRFLLNCNHAAEIARGDFILFLNNDTQVQENWLEPLVRLMEQDPKIGLVGSKLIYPDGSLQEAGGILWCDGSAWNYGNGQDASRPEYNYVKDTDYISGAAIMIRRSLWEEIGGFDEYFAPAYYEDTDLAFTVRKMGYRVVYQPLSVVVHFEGVSNGTNTSSGLKAYQVENQKRFFEKWKAVLANHRPNGQDVFKARDRSLDKQTILIVDHYVPEYDRDAGSRSTYGYILLFLRMGYNVKFIGDNFFCSPYTTHYEQLGVEVLCGDWYFLHWKEWLQDNGQYIDYAFLNRPHIAVNYVDLLRKYTKAKIAYYGHDLHFLRMKREYQIVGDSKLLIESDEWKKREFFLMRKMDVVYYPSYVEIEMIKEVDPQINAKAIPVYLFDDVPHIEYKPNERKDLFFIGGFGHSPNVDAVKWLANELMPLIRQKRPDINIRIAGSRMPDEIKQLAGNGLIMEGMVSDERLQELYAHSRISIIPLRYGAGVKGKVVESLFNALPLVTTSCGAEGIIEIENVAAIADDAQTLANKVIELYDNYAELKRMSEEGQANVRKYFSERYACEILGQIFTFDA